MIVMWKRKTHTNHTGENFTLNFPSQHVCMRDMLKRNHVLTEEKLYDISRRSENSICGN
jgi:hypothetical protein